MNAQEMLASAERRIQDSRTATAELAFVSRAGRAFPRLEAQVRLTQHEFKLGANAYRLGGIADAGLQKAYDDRFASLLNYATLPFYWGGYEPEMDRPGRQRLEAMADWCLRNRIAAKGHPLVWHEVFPSWAASLSEPEVLERLERRVREIVSGFRGRIGIWDVVNEATVSHRFDNTVGRWMARDGAAECVAKSLQWAHEANPQAVLLYNDFNVSESFENLVGALQQRKAPFQTLGIQSHMHKAHWPIEKVWQVCETYSRFGLPLHFTEATVLSGRFKTPEDNDWHKRHTDWTTTPEGEARQLEYGQQFYTTLFSHPAVEAITWWDFSDEGSWQGAPAGLVRSDMTPKPLHDWLMEAFHRRWRTDARVTADSAGRATVRCFAGEHEVSGRLPSGQELCGTFTFARRGDRKVKVTLD
jgi:GH35 family endo-1,4-beta-xylanase